MSILDDIEKTLADSKDDTAGIKRTKSITKNLTNSNTGFIPASLFIDTLPKIDENILNISRTCRFSHPYIMDNIKNPTASQYESDINSNQLDRRIWSVDPQLSIEDLDKIRVTQHWYDKGRLCHSSSNRTELLDIIGRAYGYLIARKPHSPSMTTESVAVDFFTQGLKTLDDYIFQNLDVFIKQEIQEIEASRRAVGEIEHSIDIKSEEVLEAIQFMAAHIPLPDAIKQIVTNTYNSKVFSLQLTEQYGNNPTI